MTANLSVVGPDDMPRVDRVKKLQTQLRVEGAEIVNDLRAALDRVGELSREAVAIGEPVPVGIREIASRLAKDADAASQNITVLIGRAR